MSVSSRSKTLHRRSVASLLHDLSRFPTLATLATLGLAVGVACDDPPRGDRTIRPALRAPGCVASDLIITRFPLDGINGRDWMINNYVDLDATHAGRRDYTNNLGALARTYDGHRGLDIDIPSFREMDGDGAVVRAVAPGIVDQVIQDQPDRNTSCAGSWNVVRVRHANGFQILYGHIKRGSARVISGQAVRAGTPLAIAGSAGCSTQPHLHLEVQTCAGDALETLRQPGMWIAPPVYNPTSGIMDVMLRAGVVPAVAEIKDPSPNPSLIAPDSTLGVGLSAAVRGGDVIDVTLIDPRGRSSTQTLTVEGGARFAHAYPRFALAIGATVGAWIVQVSINGVAATSRTVAVSRGGGGLARLRPHPGLTRGRARVATGLAHRAVVFCRRHGPHSASAGVTPGPGRGCRRVAPDRCAGRQGAGARPRSIPKPHRFACLHRGPGGSGP